MVACVLAGASGSGAAVLAWRDGGTIHLSNDPAAAPSEGTMRRFETRGNRDGSTAASQAAAQGPETPRMHVGTRAPQRADYRPLSAPFSSRPLIIAPTIVVRQGAPTVTVIDEAPAGFDYRFLSSGFIGHEHPQVPFSAGRRLIEHSHFFARGHAGRFTPWGHFSSNGLLDESIPAY